MVNLDVLVIGAGTAGGYAASTAKQNADSVGIVEKGQVGGDCIFHACIPTKALVHAARAYRRMRSADFYGLPTITGDMDYGKVKAFKDRIVAGIGTGRDERLAKSDISLLRGKARFVSPHEVVVGDELVKADQIIIATGSMPSIPPIPGLKEAGYITSIEALELEKVPARLAIVGGGPVGVEFAQIFAAFGSRVYIYEALDRILATEDEEIAEAMQGFFTQQGVTISKSVRVAETKLTGSGKLVITQSADGERKSEEYDEILVATGRRADIDELDLVKAGVEISRKGITVSPSLRTNVPHIWAAGDVTGMFPFTLIAWEQGELAGANATGEQQKELNYDVLPRVTFCDPEIASVGLTEKQARERGYRIKIGKYDYANLTRTIVSNETEGFIKIVAEEDSGRILGGHIVGVEASSLIHEVAVAMQKNLTASDIGNTLHAYPTLSEGVRYACQMLM